MTCRFPAAIGGVTLPLLFFAATASAAPAAPGLASVRAALDRLGVPFVANAGQWDSRAAFAAQTHAGTLFVTTDGALVYRLTGKPAADDARANRRDPARDRTRVAPARASGWVLTETLVDTNQQPRRATPAGWRPEAGKVSYAIGSDESRHRDGIPGYERVDLGEVYPGINAQLRATDGNVEKIFVVAPHRDPGRIRVRLDGALRIELGQAGELLAQTADGPVTWTAPIGYQEDASGDRTAVPVHYVLDATTRTYGFGVGAYDAGRPLVIDPLLQSTYVGGSNDDRIAAVAIHPGSGEVYVAGYTYSTDFPKVAGSEQPAHASDGGSYDVTVTRLNPALTARLQSTYIGGNGDDFCAALAISPSTGDVYVAGYTLSTDFPKVAGSEQTTFVGPGPAFVTRLNAALTSRLQSTYLGGSGGDGAYAMAVHPSSGDVYVAGWTSSTDFPKVSGAEQAVKAAGSDAFVTRLNAALTSRIQSSYLGGNGEDKINALVIHPGTGEVYVTGETSSTDFPKVIGAEQTAHAGGFTDAFVTRFDAGLFKRQQSTYLGGNGDESAVALAIHPLTGEVYVTGFTQSTNFPKAGGSEQSTLPGIISGFVTRLDAGLNARVQSTYLGGTGVDVPAGLAIHPATGDVYVAGNTLSSDFPKVAGSEQASVSGTGNEGFVSRLSADLRGDGAVPAGLLFPAKITVAPGSLQVSAPATIGGLLDNPQAISIFGGNIAQYCVSSTASCNCDVLPYGAAPATVANGQSICVRQYAPPIVPGAASATVLVGGGSAIFYVSTAVGCGLDVDGNGAVDALTDGLIILRAMFGLTGTSATHGAIGPGAARTTWAQIQSFLNANCGTGFAP